MGVPGSASSRLSRSKTAGGREYLAAGFENADGQVWGRLVNGDGNLGNADITDDAVANRLLRLIVAKAASSPCAVRRSLLAGGQSLYVSWSDLAGSLDLDEDGVRGAIQTLHESGYLSLDGRGDHGAHVWIRAKLKAVA